MNVIEVHKVSKMYRLGNVSTGTISHDLNRWWHKVRGKEDPYTKIAEANARDARGSSEYVWSLRDINFNVKQGEILGIVGRNGAGKSTLLKILSRVTGPTTGSIKMRGRVASLLEVGTGFHPELTGRENVFLNGAILGMTKNEIKRKFDEIVDFSGVERYIDTPVKRYSSGMYVRLAFGVAAHLEPEILIIDEVLAVGDAEFQKKCLGKMKDVSDKEGRTVLFVSHNMMAVKTLCNSGLLLNKGNIEFTGSASETVEYYTRTNSASINNSPIYESFDKAPGNDIIRIKQIEIKPDLISIENSVEITFHFWYTGNDKEVRLAFDLINLHEQVVFGSGEVIEINEGIGSAKCIIPANLLNDDVYSINLYFLNVDMQPLYNTNEAASFEVTDKERNYAYFGKINGVVRPKLQWIK